VWWLTEGVPDRRIHPFVGPLSALRLAADGWLARRANGHAASPRLEPLTRGHRLRIFGELQWFADHGVMDVLAVTSESRARFLRGHGLSPVVVPLGYHPAHFGLDLGLERDIDVLFLGQPGPSRRRRILEGVTAELGEAGVQVVAPAAAYGEKRTRLLNRSRILLNILRAPQDFVGQRFLLGAANKALVVSEPAEDTAPFVPGRHLVVAPVERLAETVVAYLRDEPARQRLADEAHRFATAELSVERMVGRVLDEVGRTAPSASARERA
jgi:hypothetical protein